MVCEVFSQGSSIVHRLDPRTRILISLAFSLAVIACRGIPVLFAGVGLAVISAVIARMPFAATLRHMAPVNALMLFLLVLMPLSVPGTALFTLGPLEYTSDGAIRAAAIALKGNAIVLSLAVFLGTMELTTLGHALSHLRVPNKLTHLFLFTVRYIDVLYHEYSRLVTAMKVRCFRPRMSVHTYRALGYLVGRLVVMSFERSERIMAAMKCRGFHGRFYVLDHFAMARRDAAFGAVSVIILAALVWVNWL